MSDLYEAALEADHHMLVAALIDEIPIHGEPWGATKRAKWIAAAQSVFDLLYTEQGTKKKAEEPAVTVPPKAAPGRKHIDYGSEFLTEAQSAILEALNRMPARSDGWVAEPMRAIAMAAGISQNLINVGLEALEKKGLIKIQRRGGDGVNRYFVEGREESA